MADRRDAFGQLEGVTLSHPRANRGDSCQELIALFVGDLPLPPLPEQFLHRGAVRRRIGEHLGTATQIEVRAAERIERTRKTVRIDHSNLCMDFVKTIRRGSAAEDKAILAPFGQRQDHFRREASGVTKPTGFVYDKHERVQQHAAYLQEAYSRGADQQFVVDEEDAGGAIIAFEQTPTERRECLDVRAPGGVNDRQGAHDEEFE